jgi:hypothetical protein
VIVRDVAVMLVVEVEPPPRYVAAATLMEAAPLMQQPICFSRTLPSASCRRLSRCSPAGDQAREQQPTVFRSLLEAVPLMQLRLVSYACRATTRPAGADGGDSFHQSRQSARAWRGR